MYTKQLYFLIFSFTFWLAMVSVCMAKVSFENITDSAGTLSRGVGNGVAFGDFDNDGKVDLYVSSDPQDVLYRNLGNRKFEDVTDRAKINIIGDGVSCIWGDYDNDGNLDVYVTVMDGANMLWQNQGDRTFKNVAKKAGVDSVTPSRGANFVDFDNDGFLDIYATAPDGGPNLLYRNNGDGIFTEIGKQAGVAGKENSRIPSWGDYDNDGDLDLYVCNRGASNYLYRNDGNGKFTDVTKQADVDVPGDSTACAWADIDNDGDLDLITANNPEDKVFRNNGDGTFSDISKQSGLGVNGNSSSVVMGDYDNDGWLDAYIAVWEGDDALFHNKGNGTFEDVTKSMKITGDGNGWGAAWADIDNDGDLDLYVSYTTKQNILYENRGGGEENNWLQIETVGTKSNTTGIGVRVTLTAGGIKQIREVSGGEGYGSQPSPTVEFGLGKSMLAQEVEIVWPSGEITTLERVYANQKIIVTEGKNTYKVAFRGINFSVSAQDKLVTTFGGIKATALLQNYPNPFNPETWIPYELANEAEVTIRIYNTRGQLIRTISPGNKNAGIYITKDKAAYWNGRTQTGESAASGIYFYTIQASNFTATKRMILVK